MRRLGWLSLCAYPGVLTFALKLVVNSLVLAVVPLCVPGSFRYADHIQVRRNTGEVSHSSKKPEPNSQIKYQLAKPIYIQMVGGLVVENREFRYAMMAPESGSH